MVAAIDLGSTAVRCTIARADGERLRLVSNCEHRARGINAGAIVDMNSAIDSVRHAVQGAEEAADVTLSEVFVNFSTGFPTSHTDSVEIKPSRNEVGARDLRRAYGQALAHHESGTRKVAHVIPVDYVLDQNRGIREPIGMFGETLVAEFHVVTAAAGPLQNLRHCVEQCQLSVSDYVVSPFATGLGCLTEDECELGVTMIAMGGGTTGIAVFSEGRLNHIDVVQVGGRHVTKDLANGLSTSTKHAERMKVLYGSAVTGLFDEREMIDVPPLTNGHGATPVPRTKLVEIVHARMAEIFEIIRGRLATSGFEKLPGQRIVLTGGGSQLPGVCDLAAEILNGEARIGKPIGIESDADITVGPAFTTSAGLLIYGAASSTQLLPRSMLDASGLVGPIDRIGQWFREHT